MGSRKDTKRSSLNKNGVLYLIAEVLCGIGFVVILWIFIVILFA